MINTVSVRELRRMRFGANRRLLDLREPEIFRQGHFPQAENYPYDTMEQWERKLPRRVEYILICEHGNNALRATGKLASRGYRAAAVVGGYRYLALDTHS